MKNSPFGSVCLVSPTNIKCIYIGLHSLWSLPVAVVHNGGVVFLLVYFIMLALVGAPLLLLEMTLGQVRPVFY